MKEGKSKAEETNTEWHNGMTTLLEPSMEPSNWILKELQIPLQRIDVGDATWNCDMMIHSLSVENYKPNIISHLSEIYKTVLKLKLFLGNHSIEATVSPENCIRLLVYLDKTNS